MSPNLAPKKSPSDEDSSLTSKIRKLVSLGVSLITVHHSFTRTVRSHIGRSPGPVNRMFETKKKLSQLLLASPLIP